LHALKLCIQRKKRNEKYEHTPITDGQITRESRNYIEKNENLNMAYEKI
jgi:hypothetical protein